MLALGQPILRGHACVDKTTVVLLGACCHVISRRIEMRRCVGLFDVGKIRIKCTLSNDKNVLT